MFVLFNLHIVGKRAADRSEPELKQFACISPYVRQEQKTYFQLKKRWRLVDMQGILKCNEPILTFYPNAYERSEDKHFFRFEMLMFIMYWTLWRYFHLLYFIENPKIELWAEYSMTWSPLCFSMFVSSVVSFLRRLIYIVRLPKSRTRNIQHCNQEEMKVLKAWK